MAPITLSVKCTALLRSVTRFLNSRPFRLRTVIVDELFVTAVVWANKDRTRYNGNDTQTGAINRMWGPVLAGADNIIDRYLDFGYEIIIYSC